MITNRRAAVRVTRCGVVCAVAWLWGVAAAQPPAPASDIPVAVTVEADAQCATSESLAERVRRRSHRLRFVDDAADVPRVRVRVSAASEQGRAAELFLQWPDGRQAERRLTARSCRSALDALALLLAMTLDPDVAAGPLSDTAHDSPGHERTAPAPAAPDDLTAGDERTAPALLPGSPGQAAAPEAQPAEAMQPLAASQRQTSSGAASPGPTAAPIGGTGARALDIDHVALGAGALAASGLAPMVMPGIGAWGLLSFAGAGLWTPAVGLRFAHLWLRDVAETGGDASFALDSAELEMCPLGGRWSSVSAYACSALSAGRLSAGGENSYAPRAHAEAWASVGVSALASVELGYSLELQGGLELVAPITRYRFAFGSEVFHTVAALVVAGHIGASVRFP